MKLKKQQHAGYVLPVAMAVMSVLTFTMLGVMETSQVEEKKASNEQYRRLVEQVARSELKSQNKFLENNKTLLKQPANHQLTPILSANGCASNAKDAICQTVSLNYLSDIPKPAELQLSVPRANFTGHQFEVTSRAEHKRSGAVAQASMELKYVDLEIWLRRDIPDSVGKFPNRHQLNALLGFYIPQWWEVNILSPWRIGCVTPSVDVLSILTGFLVALGTVATGGIATAALIGAGIGAGAAGGFTSGQIVWQASCVVQYVDRQGLLRKWDSGILYPGSTKVFIVPEGSSNVFHYWNGYLLGSTAGHFGFWDAGITRWWRIKQFSWPLPEPVDFCRLGHGVSVSPQVDPCPFGMLNDVPPIVGP